MHISSVIKSKAAGATIGFVALILTLTALFLLWTLPDGDTFNREVERLFVENDGLTAPNDLRLLEILAQSGTQFSEVLVGYRATILILLIFSATLLVTSVICLIVILSLTKRISSMERKGFEVASLLISRANRCVVINDMEYRLTDAALETLSALAEARIDDEMLTGAQLEGLISGKPKHDCDEAAGATRIKRLRDGLGNQIISALLVRNVTRHGYVLSVDPKVIKIL